MGLNTNFLIHHLLLAFLMFLKDFQSAFWALYKCFLNDFRLSSELWVILQRFSSDFWAILNLLSNDFWAILNLLSNDSWAIFEKLSSASWTRRLKSSTLRALFEDFRSTSRKMISWFYISTYFILIVFQRAWKNILQNSVILLRWWSWKIRQHGGPGNFLILNHLWIPNSV